MENQTQPVETKKKFGCLHVLLILIILLLAAILGSLWWLNRNVYASAFKPVVLAPAEQVILDAKLEKLQEPSPAATEQPSPKAYSEDETKRHVTFNEKELNALIGRDTSLANRLAIDLSDSLVSFNVIAPMDPDLPLFGGKTLKFNMGVSLTYTNQKPTVTIRGISLGGIPLPGAWWGDIKNKNLVEAFGAEGSFWDHFSRGVEYLDVKDGKLILHLKE